MRRLDIIRDRTLAAVARRVDAGLPSEQTNCYRLIHDRWDGLPGLMVDRFANVAILRIRTQGWRDAEALLAVCEVLQESGCTLALAVIDAPDRSAGRAHTDRGDQEALREALDARGFGPVPDRWDVMENGRTIEIRADEGLSPGLFVDMRDQRRELAERWHNRRVLNLFAYTCGFGVFLAPENDVLNVDVSQKYLDWGRRNYELNGIEAGRSFLTEDAFAWLARLGRRDETWDAIILDPPAFSRGRRGRSRRFSLRSDFAELIDLSLGALCPEHGELFVSTNLAGMSINDFESLVDERTRLKGFRLAKKWKAAPDFPTPPVEYHLKSALVCAD